MAMRISFPVLFNLRIGARDHVRSPVRWMCHVPGFSR